MKMAESWRTDAQIILNSHQNNMMRLILNHIFEPEKYNMFLIQTAKIKIELQLNVNKVLTFFKQQFLIHNQRLWR